ncbi:hypothetical protein MFUR16E_32020 [Methylobacterium fujisawaense]|uniref:hypothetical protein n=1 Tax=Methylobacterium fujisawaense TaxID=107400 RepID=UPI002F2C632D
MRKFAFAMLILAGTLAATRLFTGIYYRPDSALAYFVLKLSPDPAVERSRVDDGDFDRVVVLDDDELDLAYGELYRRLMAATPVATAVLTVLGSLLLRRKVAS